MTILKTLGLTALASSALMGFVGAAGATELYSGENRLSLGSTVVASQEAGTSIAFESTTGETIATCGGSSLKGEITNVGGPTSTASIAVESLIIDNGCSVTVDQTRNGLLEIHHDIATKDGIIKSGAYHFVVHSAKLGACTYSLGSSLVDIGRLTGSASTTATLDIDAVLLEQEPKRLQCPDTGRWKASYSILEPDPMHVTAKAPPELDINFTTSQEPETSN